MTSGPYAEAAWLYRAAGWTGALPLPPGAKSPPPGGYTGWAGVDPSGADIQAWTDGPEGAGNIALRLPVGVYGLDIDAYGAKQGASALTAAVSALGELPPTWRITSRDDGVSGIRLYRAELPPGRRWRDEPAGHGVGIEAIHFGHRYAATWPSVHPETGRTYVLYAPDGALAAGGVIPRLDELPGMPDVWIEALSETGEVATGEAASHADTLATVTTFPVGEACTAIREATERALTRLRDARDGAALHPAGRDATHEIVRLGHEGHAGARAALARHFSAFVEVRSGRDGEHGKAEAEWWRLVRGAVGKLAGAARESCDCGLRAGDGLLFEPGPATSTAGEDAGGGEGGAGGVDLADALIGRMLTPAQLRDRPPPAPLIEGLLSLDSASWLIAAPGSYKSFVALDWAAHVGGGRAWLGREVARGPVVYVVAEGVGGMGPRIRAWEQRNGEMTGVLFLPMPVQVAREDHWRALVEACRRIGPVMIILDTQARITLGLDENDNSQMSEFVEAVELLRRSCGACVLVVHHVGRNGQHARGASAIDGAQDTEIRLTRPGEPRRVVLQIDKSKNAADDVRIDLELFLCELDGGGTSLVVGPPLSAAAPMPDHLANLPLNQRVLADVMTEIFPMHGATKAELKAEVRKRVRVNPAGDPMEPMGDSSFRRAWDDLLEAARLIRVEGSQRYVLETALANMDGDLSK